MPSYNFLDKNTNEEIVLTMSINELGIFKNENPNMVQLLTTLNLADPTRVGVSSKPDDEFRQVLKEIKRKNPKSNINTF